MTDSFLIAQAVITKQKCIIETMTIFSHEKQYLLNEVV